MLGVAMQIMIQYSTQCHKSIYTYNLIRYIRLFFHFLTPSSPKWNPYIPDCNQATKDCVLERTVCNAEATNDISCNVMFPHIISFLPSCDLQLEERMKEEGKKIPNKSLYTFCRDTRRNEVICNIIKAVHN